MKSHRRQFLHLATGAVVLPAAPRIARAQAYPTRPITMIVPFAAGGGYDLVGRIMAERMRSSLGQSIIIENVSGANGMLRRRVGGALSLVRMEGKAVAVLP
jgi:tripartite-type tricarboxylate transporter receptor subunit TctC